MGILALLVSLTKDNVLMQCKFVNGKMLVRCVLSNIFPTVCLYCLFSVLFGSCLLLFYFLLD